ncbi:MFS transporter [Emcibacter sp. SYSU 3D8]|uniref:MFS transporter n=1 Tax=Emcibacter sp. SYSU 3D8 TaxID=3133969 RepID=UPI0031FE9116
MSTNVSGASHLVSLRPLGLGALSAVMVLGYAGGLAMPFNMQAIGSHFQTTQTMAGAVAAGELIAISLTSFIAARYAARIDPRRGIAAGVFVILLANLATLFVQDLFTLAAVRFIAGCGAGPAIALTMSLAGRSDNPRVTFGVTNSAIGVMGMFLSVGVPTALETYGMQGAYGVYALCGVIALPLVLLVPSPPKPVIVADSGPAEVPSIPKAGWAALIGLAMILFGNGVLMMLIFTIGVERAIPPATLKLIFFIASFAMAIGPLIAGFLGSKLSATLPISVIIAGLVISAWMLGNMNESVVYIIFGPLFAVLPILMLPIALAAFSVVDPSGRMAGTFPSFMTFAAAFAPFVGGRVKDLGGDPALGWVAVVFIVIGGILLGQIAVSADRLRRQQIALA